MAITTNVPYGFELGAMPLEAFGGVGGHRLKPIPGSLQLHGGRARKIIAPVVAIAAAVAIPFAAPAVVAAVGASTAVSAAVVGAATGAVIGAAGGAASAAIAGGNVGQGALLGGAGGAIGGGIAGYAAAPAATATTAPAATTATTATQAPLGTVASATPTAAPTVAAPVGTGLAGSNIATTTQIAGQVAGGAAPAGASFLTPAASVAPGSLGAALSGAGGYIPGTAPAVAAGTGIGGSMIPTVSQLGQQAAAGAITSGAGIAGTAIPSVVASAPTVPTFGGTAVTGLGPTLGAAATGQLATAPIAGTSAATAQPNWASQFGSSLASRFTDPNTMADITLRAAGQLAGSAMAGSGLTEDQQQIVDMQMAELQQLQETNREAFNQRLEAATALLGEARYFDPEYFGLQRARQQQIAGARAKEAGLRGLTGERRRAEERRFNLETARDVGTAYDQGFLTGVSGRLQTQQAGLNALPTPSSYTTPYSSAFDMSAAGEAQRARAAEATGQLFGGLFGSQSARSLG